MKNQTPKRKQNQKRVALQDFDGEGVQRALLATLTSVYHGSPHITFPQYLVALEVLIAERDGNPHTLVSLVKKLNMPFSTASRVVWSLTAGGGDMGVIKYIAHPTDRRKKFLAMETNAVNKAFPKAMQRTMIDYYGDSLKRLKRVEN